MPPSAVRPIIAGNSQAAIGVLDLMLEAWPSDDVLVVAAPETSRHAWQPSLVEAALERGVPLLTPERVNDEDVIAAIRDRGSDLLLSVYYTQIFRPELLDAVGGPALNFHPALLPRHHGTAPLIWAIADGDTVTGVTVHHLIAGVDTGAIVDQQPLPIHPDDTGYSLHRKATVLVQALAAKVLRAVARGGVIPPGRPQTGTTSYHSSRDPMLNHLDWEQPRSRIRDIVRALAPPLPGAYVVIGDDQVVLERVEPAGAVSRRRPPGMLQFERPTGPALVWAGDGAVEIVSFRHDDTTLPGTQLRERLQVADGDMVR